MIKLQKSPSVSADDTILITPKAEGDLSLAGSSGTLNASSGIVRISQNNKYFDVIGRLVCEHSDGVIAHQNGYVAPPYAFKKGSVIPLFTCAVFGTNVNGSCDINFVTREVTTTAGESMIDAKPAYYDCFLSCIRAGYHASYKRTCLVGQSGINRDELNDLINNKTINKDRYSFANKAPYVHSTMEAVTNSSGLVQFDGSTFKVWTGIPNQITYYTVYAIFD